MQDTASPVPGIMSRTDIHHLTLEERLAISDATFPSPVKPESSLEDLDRAIQHQQERLQCLPMDHPDRPHVLYDESIVWYFKFCQRSDPDDLDQSIQACQSAASSMSNDFEGQSTIYQFLAGLFQKRCRDRGDPKDQNDAFLYGKMALMELSRRPDSGSRKWWTLQNETLSTLCSLVNRFPGNDTLNWLLVEHRNALSTMDVHHRFRARYMSRLSHLLTTRRSNRDIHEAIIIGFESIKALESAETHDFEYGTLAHTLFVHYQMENLYRSLEEATEYYMLSLEHDLPEYRSATLSNIGSIMEAKCQRFRRSNHALALEAISKAIEIGDHLVSNLDDRDYRSAHFLNMTGAWYTTKMEMVGDIKLGVIAATLQERALKLRCSGQAEYSHILHSLSHLYEVQYQILDSHVESHEAFQRLNSAITYAENSVKETNAEDPFLGERRLNLGKMLLRKHLITKDLQWDLRATEYFISAFKTISAPLQIRLQGAIQAGLTTYQEGSPAEAAEIFDEALRLLSNLSEYSISNEDLQQTLRFISGLATYAASIALEANRAAYEVLTYLETGRCIIASIAMNTKRDLSDLLKIHPEIAREYDELRKQYAQASKDLTRRETYREGRERQKDLTKRLSDMEDSIRSIDGWEKFGLMFSESDVQNLAVDGPIVVVNVTQVRSDALVIAVNGISVVKLPDMSYEKLNEYVPLFDHLGNDARRNFKKSRQEINKNAAKDALLWLWTVAVHPILGSTKLTSSRRIWWITTGLAGRAPFHAAGDHSPGSRNNTVSQAMSSYISSLKALWFSRSRVSNISKERQMLLVTMSENPSPHRNLNTSHEVTAIRETFTGFSRHLEHPKPEDVLTLLPSFQFVHFACHGASISYDPSQSGLLLVQDGKPAMLTIAELEKIDIREGAVAYLSACSTAEQADSKLADEAIHLANSFQALGFQHVIGTMWGAEDCAAGEIARCFYAKLFRLNTGTLTYGNQDIAQALHEAVLEYREEKNANVVSWGPFVHIGP